MKALLFYVGIPVILGLLSAVLASARVKDADAQRRLYLRLGIAVAAAVGWLSLAHLAIQLLFASYGEPLPVSAVIVTTLCAIGALWPAVGKRENRPRLNRWYRVVGAAAVVCMLLELFVCNFGSLCTAYQEVTVASAELTHSGNASEADDALVVNANSEFTVRRDCTGVSTLGLRFASGEHPARIQIWAKDDNFSEKSTRLLERTVATDTGHVYLPLNTYGTLHEVTVKFTDMRSPLSVTEVVLSNAVPFHFSSLRFVGGVLLIALIAAVCYGRLYAVRYDRRKLSHKGAVLTCFALALVIPATMLIAQFPLKESDVDYPIDNAEGHDAYIQQFDAFMKGQVHLDIPVHESLLALDDPYDNSLRNPEDGEVIHKYDRAYYNGQYYSYFGITPLLVGYFPYYWITGALPTTAPMCCIFAVGAVVFLLLAILRFVRYFCDHAPLCLLLLSLLTAAFCAGVYWFMLAPSMYNLPLLSGICFLMMTLWAGLGGYTAKSPAASYAWLALCAVGAVLVVGSRPTMTLGCIVLAPAFIHILLRRDYTRRRKLLSAVAFLVPLGMGAAAIMWYNAVRFGSPLEFGAVYQLTVSNVAANTFSLSLIPAALYHYILQPFSVEGQFPHIRPNYSVLSNYGRYVYIEHTVGLLAFPHLTAGACSLPCILRRFKKAPVKAAMLLLTPLIAVVLAVLDFMMGGVTMRYLGDFLPLVAMMATPVLLLGYTRLSERLHLGHRLFPAAVAVLSASLFIGVCFTVFTARDCAIVKDHFPQLIAHLEDAVMFWR